MAMLKAIEPIWNDDSISMRLEEATPSNLTLAAIHRFLITWVGEASSYIRRQLQDYSLHDGVILFKELMMVSDDD